MAMATEAEALQRRMLEQSRKWRRGSQVYLIVHQTFARTSSIFWKIIWTEMSSLLVRRAVSMEFVHPEPLSGKNKKYNRAANF